jgi:hypothetical protein
LHEAREGNTQVKLTLRYITFSWAMIPHVASLGRIGHCILSKRGRKMTLENGSYIHIYSQLQMVFMPDVIDRPSSTSLDKGITINSTHSLLTSLISSLPMIAAMAATVGSSLIDSHAWYAGTMTTDSVGGTSNSSW